MDGNGQGQEQAAELQRVIRQMHQLAQFADEQGDSTRGAELRRAASAYEAQLAQG